MNQFKVVLVAFHHHVINCDETGGYCHRVKFPERLADARTKREHAMVFAWGNGIPAPPPVEDEP